MTFPLAGYVGLGALLAGTLAGWTVRDWKADSDALEAENKAHTQFVADAQALADQSRAYEALAQSTRNAERRDGQTIREVYREKIVPAECAADPAVVSLLGNAVTEANAATAGKPSGTVPRASPTAGPPYRP